MQALIAEHLAGMQVYTPPGMVHALAVDSLREPSVTFVTAWLGPALCGCGAIRQLDATTAEIKSMRTRAPFLRRGVGQAVLDHLIGLARQLGCSRVVLETGTGEAFAAAHALYRRNGFVSCGAFGSYQATDFNVFMERALAPAGQAA